ncbi:MULTISPECIES: hypothetical protein [unclassified Streptomyces]|uniref:Uncharacterized protein n=1 Tax=Streptomyces evansiae TaxID=3075535 RepID=A0ABU2R9F2_9ACTN|nr:MULTISPECIES: hypothetical protein [unclassified Streptomyces]MDT0413334.1 hypothetical protein [Streptomyces sp. DSM 41979]MYQ55869.1 hypothetical protein [Streptomyces sp. SID4926]MYR28196.1 hypothetical protein [Streptomyces sp. SID4945]
MGEEVAMDVSLLAGEGATALVGLMVADGWTAVRERVARFFSRGDDGAGEVERVEAELEEARQDLVDAGEGREIAEEVEAAWRLRFRRALREHPEAAGELRALLDELAPERSRTGSGDTYNSVSGTVHGGLVVQGRDFGTTTIGYPQSAPRREGGGGEGDGRGWPGS